MNYLDFCKMLDDGEIDYECDESSADCYCVDFEKNCIMVSFQFDKATGKLCDIDTDDGQS